MVEMDMSHGDRLAQWHAWYEAHVDKLLTMPGFISAQRFVSIGPTLSPYLAIYSVTDESALTNPTYTARAGPQSASTWAPFMSNWQRNLLDGVTVAAEVNSGQWIALIDRQAPDAPELPPGFARLKPVGLDCSMVERGLRWGAQDEAPPSPAQAQGWTLRVWRPLSAQKVASGARAGP